METPTKPEKAKKLRNRMAGSHQGKTSAHPLPGDLGARWGSHRRSKPFFHLLKTPATKMSRSEIPSRSSSREVRIRVPFFFFVYCGKGTLPTKKETGEKGHLAGGPCL